MKKLAIVFVGVLLSFILATNAYAGISDWKLRIVGDVDNNESLVHFAWDKAVPPYGTFDKITLHRVVKKTKMFFNPRVIFMLPGTWNAGGWSGITDPNVNTMLFLANNNYDVYTIDYRSVNIPDMDYEQFSEYGIDISSTTDWTYGVFREDIKECVNFIKMLSSVDKVFMSGFSRGGYHMFFYARKYPDDLRGMVVLDISIKDLPPQGTPLDEATYNQVVNLFKAGLLVDPDTLQVLPWVYGVFFLDTLNYNNWKLAGVLPFCKNMVGGPLPADFAVISDYVANNVYHVWDYFGLGEGALANYHGGYIDREILVKAINEFSRYYPHIQSLEDTQMEAYDDVPYFDYDDNDIYLPTIAFLTRYIGCPYDICLMDILPNITRSQDITINLLSGYGHMDIMFGKNSLTDVKQPLLAWLNAHMNGGSSQVLSWQAPEHQFVDSLLNLIKPLFQIEEK
jgi:pimeloyl-ACP methyl ester carboxylesterase